MLAAFYLGRPKGPFISRWYWRSLTDAAKKARLSLTSSRKEEKKENINIDGQIYGAGIAD
ncbi:hypothetical protein NQ318_019531 [Aromia moschata]|uniref:Uncharacterized protein n=1 Tax=Aromia moschata TaxID=1265417 RepID=A0AAV8XI19_9CUCU|nr:hypothetical protein NQ318_019531 [Aromia moschata]